MFEISVRHSLTGRNKTLNVESTTHTCELAQMVSEQMPMLHDGKPLTRRKFRLIFGGKELFECGGSCDKTCRQLQDYKIEAGATVHLVLRGPPAY